MSTFERDPRTYQPKTERSGLCGHPGYGRDEVLFLRIPLPLKNELVARATSAGKTLTDLALELLAVGLYGPRTDIPVAEPPAPQLTSEVAAEYLAAPIKEAYASGLLFLEDEVSDTVEEEIPPKPVAPDLWTNLAPALTKIFGEDTFDIWFSTVYLLSASDSIVLSCPSAYMQDTLTRNYKDAIEQELQQTGDARPVVFQVVEPPVPKAVTSASPPKKPLSSLLTGVSTIEELEAFEVSTFPKLYRARMLQASRVVTRYYGSLLTGLRKVGFNEAQMAEEIAVIKTQRLAEEKAYAGFADRRRILFTTVTNLDKLRQPGNPRSQHQYAQASHWDTDGRPDRGLVNDAARALKNNLKD